MLQTVENMLKAGPKAPFVAAEVIARCIEACEDCAQACTACADACLGEADVRELAHCIRLCLDCADLCDAAARILSRQQEPDTRLLMRLAHLCAIVAGACGEECERHASEHEHCGVCARVCRRCEDACCALTTC
jgi:hypothetical protein